MGRGKNLQQTGFYNSVPILDLNRHTSESNQIQSSVYGQWTIVDGLSVKTQYGIDNVRAENITFRTPIHGDGSGLYGASPTFVFSQAGNPELTW